MPTLKKSLGYGAGSCRCAEKHLFQTDAIPRSTKSNYDITFDHVADFAGNKLHVENIRQLERAEQTYGFQSVVLNKDAQNFDDAPQQPVVDMARVHNWKWSNEQRFREMQGRR
jgi:hypothetical protein